MRTKILKCVSIAALVMAGTFWSHAAAYELPLRFLVSLGACAVALQAERAHRRPWSVGFLMLAVLFNPVFPLGTFTGNWALLIVIASVVPFVLSFRALRTQILMSIPSITDRTPRSRSL
jgi:hypothetical protein